MSETEQNAGGQRERSPSFPFIPLMAAIRRLSEFDLYFKRHPAPMQKVGLAWGMAGYSSQAQQTVAALKAFGLLDYQSTDGGRQVVITDGGRTYLRAQQEFIKRDVLKKVALQPKSIEKYWRLWGPDRPPDPVCLDELILKGGFTDRAAQTFLKVYDDTLAYAELSSADKVEEIDGDSGEPEDTDDAAANRAAPVLILPRPPVIPPAGKGKLMDGERELISGLLSKGTDFRVIVRGHIGVKEIETLIKKLEIDKGILAEDDTAEGDADER